MEPLTKKRKDGCRMLTWKSGLTGLAGVILLSAVTPYNDYHLHQTYLYGNHLPLGCLFIFTFIVLIGNTLLRRLKPHWAFKQPELLAIWAMLITGAGLASSGLMRYLGPVPLAPFYYADETNGWQSWSQFIPDWIVPSRDANSPVIKWFFEGLPDGYGIPWHPWIHVFFAWGLLFSFLIGLSLCLSMLVRRQWAESEHLAFPLVQIPMEMAREPETGNLNTFLRNRLMWYGCFIAVLIHALNGLHNYFFAVPSLLLQWDLSTSFPDPPWSGLGIGGLELFLSVVGVMFLLPTEVSFSMWFFFVLFRLFRVARVMAGQEAVGGLVPNHEQAVSVGGFIIWGVWMLRTAWPHLKALWRNRQLESMESSALKRATFGALFCFTGLVVWTWAAGVDLPFALAIWAGFSLILLVLSRIVAESGLLFVQTSFVPTDVMTAVPGSQAFNASSMGTGMMLQTVFMHDSREAMMPSMVNALRLKGEGRGRDLVAAILMAVAVGYVASFISFLLVSYRYGGVNLDSWGNIRAPQLYYNQIDSYLRNPSGLSLKALINIATGGGITAFLLLMRSQFTWWSLHPLGFLMAGTYAMQRIWFSVFAGWMFKWLVLRYGGFRAFRMFLPFFLGMVLGEALIGGIWVIVGMITGVGTPTFMPN